MRNLVRPGGSPGGGTGPAWSVVALASGGGAVATALGGVVFGHPLGGLVVAACVLIAPWLLTGVLVVATTLVAVRGTGHRPRRTDTNDTVQVIEALRRVIETLLGRR